MHLNERRVKLGLLGLLILFVANSNRLSADEIGFIERFALAADRAAVLKELVPGTEDYYYFHCLHYQNTESFDAVQELTRKWIAKFGYTHRVREILNRQALLVYDRKSQDSLAYLVNQLGLKFNHQRESLRGPSLASVLDQSVISRRSLSERALARYSNTDGFESRALDWLIDQNLSAEDLRHSLQRLRLPDHQKLVDLIIKDLRAKNSRGFGSMTIHQNLTKAQLAELAEKMPEVLNQSNYVNVFLSKIRPNPDVNFDQDKAARRSHLEEVWAFVRRLDPVHNSLKANVLYHRLVYDRSQGIYDRERFLEYLRLPRNTSTTNPDFLKLEQNRRFVCNLSANYQAQILFPPIRDDSQLVSDYLQHFFKTAQTYREYETFLRSGYLKRQFAECKIVHSLGDPEKWASLLTPSEYQSIKERVDLDFTIENKRDYLPNEKVTVHLNVKNVPKIIVKVFEINTQNYFRDRMTEIDTSVELDGLLPNWERVFEYKEGPMARRQIRFDFPELKSRGIYVIDFIGNRKSCRALIRKGQLRYVETVTAAGHELTVIDEQSQPLKKAHVWIQGKQFDPDKDGRILVPFSNRPGRVPVVLSDGHACSLDHLNHLAENYSLEGGVFVDRESLVAGQNAKVVLRTSLRCNGRRTSIELLENPRLVLTSTDVDGTVSTKEIKDLQLRDHIETSVEIKVPHRLQAIQAQLFVDVKNLSRAKTETLSIANVFYVNKIDKETKVEDIYFSQINGLFYADLLGKNAEPKPARPVSFHIKHRDFKNLVTTSLQTDMRGRIKLGALKDVAYVEAVLPEGTKRRFVLPQHRNSHQTVIAKAGEPILIPISKLQGQLDRQDVALFSVTANGSYVKDEFKKIRLDEGLLVLEDLPVGNYQLRLKEDERTLAIYVAAGREVEQQIVGTRRLSEHHNHKPLQVTRIVRGNQKTIVSVSGAEESTRVHILATRFQPSFSAYDLLAGRSLNLRPGDLPQARSSYIDGRKIGDEYQYILDRKYAEKYPGLMLQRPGMLLQPWAVRSTQTTKQKPNTGNKFAPQSDAKPRAASARDSQDRVAHTHSDESTLDFLPYGSTVLLNLAVENGQVEIDTQLLNGNQQIHVLAISHESSAYHTASFEESPLEPANRSFVSGLDPDLRFARKKEISFVKAGSDFKLTDVRTGNFELYDSLPSVYRLFSALNANAKLTEFQFILDWRNKKLTDKVELYSKYACHELNFFLSQKDPEFFRNVVAPYLKNKKDKTFLDHFLLGHDLSKYQEPWAFDQLNIVERILLAGSLQKQQPYISRYVSDLYNVQPTSQARFDQLFQYALLSSALDTDADISGVKDQISRLKAELKDGDEVVLQELQTELKKSVKQLRQAETPSLGRVEYSIAKEQAKRKSDLKFSLQGQSKNRGLDLGGKMSSESLSGLRLVEVDGGVQSDFNGLAEKRKLTEQLFRQVEMTKEWAENNYYHLPIGQQNAQLVTVNQFWRDFAARDVAEPFFSENVAEASRNFTEMMFALSVLDLAWESGQHDSEAGNNQIKLTAKSPLLIYHEQIRPAVDGRKGTTILVSQNFFRVGDRYVYDGPDRLDKFVTDEFLKQTAYGCQVVVTNPTSAKQKIDLLLQVPVGSLPLGGSLETKSVHLELEPYRTSAVEYFFYFPESGEFQHYPVNVAKDETVVAFAEPMIFHVVNEPSKVDKTSWAYISQNGTEAEVIEYLEKHNLFRVDLTRIAWRMHDVGFFKTTTRLLKKYHVFHPTLWSYAFKHNVPQEMSELLQYRNDFVSKTGPFLKTSLLTVDPVARGTYEHLEYDPLVNARAHQLGAQREILNDRFHAQYQRLLWILACKHDFEQGDLMALTYYLLLQDRITEAKQFFKKASAGTLQYDYMAAYLDMFNDQPQLARKIASRYLDYKVDRWRQAFATIVKQLDEIEGKSTDIVNNQSRDEIQSQLATRSPSFDFKVDAKQVEVNYANLDEVTVNYYVMDVELLFSRNPFVQNVSGDLTCIRPRISKTIRLPQNQTRHHWDLPKELGRSNVLVEIVSGGQTKSQAYYAHAMSVQMMESYGQLQVKGRTSGRSIPKTYCKVYARMRDGSVKFYKDGYTDLRGRFDYTSLSTNDLDNVSQFSILVMSDEHGATVQDAIPPKR